MALQQTYTDPITGSVSNYHRISAVYIDYATHEAKITVLSYLDVDKRAAEKENASSKADFEAKEAKKLGIYERLNQLLEKPTDENKKERNSLSKQLQELDEEDLSPIYSIAPRFMYSTDYTIKMNTADDYTLQYAYNWLKENVFTKSEDV